MKVLQQFFRRLALKIHPENGRRWDGRAESSFKIVEHAMSRLNALVKCKADLDGSAVDKELDIPDELDVEPN